MRKLFTLAAALALTTLVVPEASAQQNADSPVTLTGEVVDLSCKVVHGLAGEDHRMCAQVCADKGVPLAILSNGEIYLPVSMAMPGTGDNERLKPFAERRVRVTGKVIERAGVKTIIIESVKGA
jgi:predicted type IV restriction endonuclease